MNKKIIVGFALSLASLAAFASNDDYVPLDTYGVERSALVQSPESLFEAVKGASLRVTLDSWAKISGWQAIVWELPPDTDFTLGASARFQGDFLSATKALIQALGPQANLRVRIHHANRVIVVEAVQ